MKQHPKISMIKGQKYRVDARVLDMHRARNLHRVCDHDDIVINLMGGHRVWTMIQFGCGERIKINCQLLRKI